MRNDIRSVHPVRFRSARLPASQADGGQLWSTAFTVCHVSFQLGRTYISIALIAAIAIVRRLLVRAGRTELLSYSYTKALKNCLAWYYFERLAKVLHDFEIELGLEDFSLQFAEIRGALLVERHRLQVKASLHSESIEKLQSIAHLLGHLFLGHAEHGPGYRCQFSGYDTSTLSTECQNASRWSAEFLAKLRLVDSGPTRLLAARRSFFTSYRTAAHAPDELSKEELAQLLLESVKRPNQDLEGILECAPFYTLRGLNFAQFHRRLVTAGLLLLVALLAWLTLSTLLPATQSFAGERDVAWSDSSGKAAVLVQVDEPPEITVGITVVIATPPSPEVPSDCLHLRRSPGTDQGEVTCLPDGVIVLVDAGPIVAGDYRWWWLRAEIGGKTFEGWGAEADTDGTPWLRPRQ